MGGRDRLVAGNAAVPACAADGVGRGGDRPLQPDPRRLFLLRKSKKGRVKRTPKSSNYP